jgi:hypothetical protein
MNTTAQMTRRPTPTGPLAEIACVSGLIPFDGPAVGYLLFPWLFLGLILVGPFACLVVLAVVMIVAAAVVAALVAAIRMIIAAPSLLVRSVRRHRHRDAPFGIPATKGVAIQPSRGAA